MAYIFKDGVLREEKERRGMGWEQFSTWVTSDGNPNRIKNCEYKKYSLGREEMQAIADRLGRDLDDIAEEVARNRPEAMRAQLDRIEEKINRLLALWDMEGNE